MVTLLTESHVDPHPSLSQNVPDCECWEPSGTQRAPFSLCYKSSHARAAHQSLEQAVSQALTCQLTVPALLLTADVVFFLEQSGLFEKPEWMDPLTSAVRSSSLTSESNLNFLKCPRSQFSSSLATASPIINLVFIRPYRRWRVTGS